VAATGRTDISVTNPYGPPCLSIASARAELLALVQGERAATATDTAFRHGRIEYLVRVLESAHVPAQTVPFLQFTLQGEWELLYSNVLTPRRDTTLQVRMFQEIRPGAEDGGGGGGGGELRNRVAWQRDPTGADGPTKGDLVVRCGYQLTTKGDLDVTLSEHLLLPSGDTIPRDPEELVAAFQKTLPFEVFDPQETVMKHLYVDPDMRIVQVAGEVFRNVYNIFTRVSALGAEEEEKEEEKEGEAAPRRKKSGVV
jgi:hypothetical protein